MPTVEEKLSMSTGNIISPYASLSPDDALLQMVAEDLYVRKSIR